jgi:hypothetical protein
VNTILAKVLPRILMAGFLERGSLWLYLSALAGLCILQIALGALPTRIYAHDYFIFLDGTWRLANGQIPNVDFYAGYGVLIWNPLHWGLALRGYDADGIGLTRAFYTASIGIWFLLRNWLAPRRLPSMILGLFLLMFLSAARPLGEYPTWVSHAMFYNRVGYALLFLIILEQLGVSRFAIADNAVAPLPDDKLEFWRGLSTGTALACVILVKISFFLPAGALILLGLLLFGVHRRHVSGMLSGSLAVLVVTVACLHFRPIAFLHETLTLSHQRGRMIGDAVTALVLDIGSVVFILAAGFAVLGAGFRNQLIARKYMIATVVIAGCDVFCRATNAQRGDLPLAAFWCLSGAMLLYSVPALTSAAIASRQRAIALLLLCPIATPIFVMDLSSSMYAAYETAVIRKHAALRFDSTRLRNWLPLDWLGDDPKALAENGKPLILATNDGIHLLQRLSRPDETVSCIAYDNPFSYVLGRRPAEGGAVWLSLGNNIGFHNPVPEDVAIGHPDLLMVPKSDDLEGTSAIPSLYPNLLTKEFALTGSSQYWTLYRRRP